MVVAQNAATSGKHREAGRLAVVWAVAYRAEGLSVHWGDSSTLVVTVSLNPPLPPSRIVRSTGRLAGCSAACMMWDMGQRPDS